jgi:DNA-binding protein YbaB
MTDEQRRADEYAAQQDWIDQRYDALQSLGRSVAVMQERVEALRVERWSTGREVQVVVGSSGLLADVRFSERGLGLDGPSLARVTLDTYRRALRELQELVDETTADETAEAVGAATAAGYRAAFAPQIARIEDEGIGYR